MSGGSVKRVSPRDIQLVQNLIERCLQLYMNQKEVVETLLAQAKIEPGFTELVWQKLEEENREFFRAYYLRLVVKHQIIEFNKLLERQVQLLHQMQPSGLASIPTSNGSHITQFHQNSALYAVEQAEQALKHENVQHSIESGMSNSFTNGRSSMHTGMQSTIDMSTHAPHLFTNQSSIMGLIQGTNGEMNKSDPDYSGATYMFAAESNVLETRPSIGDTSVQSFSSIESSTRSLNDTLLGIDNSSYGYLSRIPRNFSLSDLKSTDIVEGYSGSPYTENYLDLREGENQGENKRLDSISDGFSYED